MTTFWKWFTAAVLLFLIFLLWRTWPASAHEWSDQVCCRQVSSDGLTGDCAPISDQFVREIDGGYAVAVPPGGHPLLPGGGTYFFPYNDSRIHQSQDWQFHLCPYRGVQSATEAHCLYVRPGST